MKGKREGRIMRKKLVLGREKREKGTFPLSTRLKKMGKGREVKLMHNR